MSPSKSAERVALLAKGSHGNEETKERWWSMRRVLDLEEARHQLMLSLPMIISNISYDFITLVSVMFAGHLGELELAGATLADSWASVTGFALMIGLSGALETLCGQGFGAKSYRMLGLHLQASCIVSFFFSIIISILWFYSESIFICLHQDPQISKIAAMYLRHLIPGLFAYGFLQNILRFLQAQSVVMPLVWFSILPMVSHFGIVYILVNWTSTGVKGASMAASISLWILFVSLAMYVTCTKQLKQTWEGLSSESFRHIFTFLKVALPSAAMNCLEDWAFELLVLLAGLMPNSNISTSLIAMCVNTQTTAFMVTGGVSAAASTRVANELGGGNPEKAKSAMAVTLKLSTILTLAIGLALAFGHNVWAAFFTDSSSIISRFASITPFLVVSITFGCFQDILSAVARGCGWQPLAAWVNLGTYYFIGIPIACLLGFMLKLYDKGLWIGIICGLFCQSIALLSFALFRQWSKIDISVEIDEETQVFV
ncbi:MATE efflux family protein ALF5 [Hibiscus syriacus]|uniref:Protein DETOXIFICATION n=1 Tax=Hibiscus syriacus TaxID=106335 RepID=A0A6A3C942_HIBSY|nr:MATE efflux family protein ALF5 [Hibiscus syriacus]